MTDSIIQNNTTNTYNSAKNSEIGGHFHCGHLLGHVSDYKYKIWDDSVNREFLGTDTDEGLCAIFEDRESHSLHEWIDGDEPLRPIIDFDLPQEEIENTIKKSCKTIYAILLRAFKDTCFEIYSD